MELDKAKVVESRVISNIKLNIGTLGELKDGEFYIEAEMPLERDSIFVKKVLITTKLKEFVHALCEVYGRARIVRAVNNYTGEEPDEASETKT